MYEGNRGNSTARKFARLWSVVFGLGLMPRRWVTLEVAGRTTGRRTRFPLGMATNEGNSYLVSMLGENCNWVKNVRAANGEVIIRRRRPMARRLVEVEVDQRADLIKLYLKQVPGARPHIGVDRNAGIDQFAKIASSTPVFRVVNRNE
jgi:hypothetical protein